MTRRVLLVEDEPEFQLLVRTALAPLDFELSVAEDGEQGLAQARAGDFDAILLDLMTPRMHGYELLQHLRAEPGTQHIPVVIISAKTFASDQRKALDMGADAFLAKPFSSDELVATLDRLAWRTRVTFWGVRGSIAAPGPETVRYGGNTPCVTIEHDKHLLILDAGTGLRRLGIDLMRRARDTPLTMQMLVTHTHWDHIQGLPFFVPAFVPGNQLNIYGPRSVDKPLEKVLRGQMDPEYFPVALGDMSAHIAVTELRGDPVTIGPFEVSYTYMNHPGVTLGYRVAMGDTVVTYATDTEPYRSLLKQARPDGQGEAYGRKRDAQLVDLAQGADLYIADSQYAPNEYDKKVGWGHTCYVDALDVAIDAQVKRLALFSHDPMHDDDAVDAKLAHCQALAAERDASLEILAATEGHNVVLD